MCLHAHDAHGRKWRSNPFVLGPTFLGSLQFWMIRSPLEHIACDGKSLLKDKSRLTMHIPHLADLRLGEGTILQTKVDEKISWKGGPVTTNAYPLVVWLQLVNPIGKGRKSGVQPDYQISYSSTSDAKAARLVIECKQYATAARKSFAAVLFDYCSACPDAAVLLVNYGPIPADLLTKADIAQFDVRRELDPEQGRSVLARARTIPHLVPGNPASRQAFTKALHAALPSASNDSSAPHTVILDVSPSMHPIDPSAVARAIKRQFTGAQPQWLLAVDSSVRRMYRFSETSLQAACQDRGSTEDFVCVMEAIKLAPDEVIIITDATGKATLQSTPWHSQAVLL